MENEVQVFSHEEKIISAAMLLEGPTCPMPGTIYQSYQVRTNKGIAIFTNEDDAREFSRIKQLDSTLDRLQLDKIMAERIKEEKG